MPADGRAPWRRWRRRLAAAALSVGTAAGLVALAPTAAAQSTPYTSFAYVWAYSPETDSYVPNGPFNRSNFGGLSSINRTGVGQYTVHFPQYSLAGGTVHVTATDTNPNFCTVVDWRPAGPPNTVDANVRCFAPSGALADTAFTANLVYAGESPPAFGYVWADRPGATSYTPSPAYQYNSSGGTNTIRRWGAGQYTAWLPSLGAYAGHVQVTAVGAAAARCKVVNWYPSGTTQLVNVRCFNLAGELSDNQFTMTYARDTSTLGALYAAYAWADSPTASVYIPSLAYQFNSFGGTNTIRRLGAGIYRVEAFGQPVYFGQVQVTGFGPSSEYCKVASWNGVGGIQVRCFSPDGMPVDAQFAVDYGYHNIIEA